MVSKEEARQEPVAWLAQNKSGNIRFTESKSAEQELEGYGWKVTPLYTHPAPVNAQEVRLWDSQWVNVVNHDNAYRDWSKEDAINHAVKMTEKLIAENVNGNKLPPAPVNQALLEKAAQLACDAVASNGGSVQMEAHVRVAIAAAEGKV